MLSNDDNDEKAQSYRDVASKREFLRKTLSEDYPGLDYLGVHNVLHAKAFWYRIVWISSMFLCLCIGIYTVIVIINEYKDVPTATKISIHSENTLLLPQITICPTNPMTLNLSKMSTDLFKANNIKYDMQMVEEFAYFMLLGSGFQKVDMRLVSQMNITEHTLLYDIFRQNMSVDYFFKFFFDTYGLQCTQLFKSCFLGSREYDCCQMLFATYTIRRGRCFRTIELKQETFDEMGKLKLEMRKPTFMHSDQDQHIDIIAFVGEHKTSLAPFPRYYISHSTWTKLRVQAKYYNLIAKEGICEDGSQTSSKAACYLREWMRDKVEGPLNCTFPYTVIEDRSHMAACHPKDLATVYQNIDDANYTVHNCILACDRWEYQVIHENVKIPPDSRMFARGKFDFRLDVSYNDLQYEMIEEVPTISFAGLLSQIGGQFSLFLGSSILNIIQIGIMLIILVKRCIIVFKRKWYFSRRKSKTVPVRQYGMTNIEAPPPPVIDQINKTHSL
uniref:Amiloride-sensitive sodium channel n=1 Tax=Rhabditophanes sp. KR3021 TaxID=114890 RepID=A0AC35U7X1_9BILA